MSIERLFNSRALVYRAEVEADGRPPRDEFGDNIDNLLPVAVPAGKNCRPDQSWNGSLVNHGPGEEQANARRWFLDKGFDVKERDIMVIESGPDAPLRLRIIGVTPQWDRNSLHHYEVQAELAPALSVTEEVTSS